MMALVELRHWAQLSTDAQIAAPIGLKGNNLHFVTFLLLDSASMVLRLANEEHSFYHAASTNSLNAAYRLNPRSVG